MKPTLDPNKLTAKIVSVSGFTEYYVRVGMLGQKKDFEGVYLAELQVGKKGSYVYAFMITGVPPADVKDIKHGEDIHTRVDLILDVNKKPKGLTWKKEIVTKTLKDRDING